MSRSLLDLANDLEKKAAKIDADASKVAVDVALAIVGDLAYSTPVDTSQAISNWITTLEAPANFKQDPYYQGEGGSTYRASAAETINQAKAALANKKPGQTIYITNNLPYIKRLNDGYSAQEPAGFVERAILIGRNVLRKFKIKGL